MDAKDPLQHRKHAARLANRAREAGEPSSWFEPLYQWAAGDPAQVPWADLEPHPLLVPWRGDRNYRDAVVVGCGLGDDAEWVAKHVDSVWAFDVSPTAIEWAKTRFPESSVHYEVADLFNLPARQFDLVVEVYTLQALSPESRPAAIRATAELVAPGGELWIVTRLREPEAELGPVPWPLLREELDLFKASGLVERTDAAPDPSGEPTISVWTRA